MTEVHCSTLKLWVPHICTTPVPADCRRRGSRVEMTAGGVASRARTGALLH